MPRSPRTHAVPRKKVAVVGSGCSGIAALWALNRSPHDVYLYEADSRLGGHTNTVEWKKEKYSAQVDTGFIVMNEATYPNFIRFLEHCKIPIEPTEMTFSVTRDNGKFEWAGTDLSTIFCQPLNVFSPYMWRMIFDIVRFNLFALDILIADDCYRNNKPIPKGVNGVIRQNETIGEYLDRNGYSDMFKQNYLIPMTAAIWSTSPDKCSLEFPAITLTRFMWNHHLLSTLSQRPNWLTIRDGAKSYIDHVMKGFPPNHLFLGTKVTKVYNKQDQKVCVETSCGRRDIYDHVILATHGDVAYDITKDMASEEEKSILSSFKTSKNRAVLHSDLSLMPKRPEAWTSWNYLTRSEEHEEAVDQVSLTYNMNILQHIPRDVYGDVLVTLNPLHEPDKSTIQGQFTYRHPLYTSMAIRGQKLLSKIQNRRGISYCGAWTKYGFHEDGFSSGLHVAQDHLGAKLPFNFHDSTFCRGSQPEFTFFDSIARLWIYLIHFFLIVPLEIIFIGKQKTLPKLTNGVDKEE